MKIEISTRMVILLSLLAVHAPAQTFTTLWNFDGGTDGSSEDPRSLILAGSTIYGTTACCSSYLDPRNHGTVFAANIDGTTFVTLYTFSGSDGDIGDAPHGSLTLSGNTLFGTTQAGGSLGNGTLFALNTDGTGFTILHNFSGGSDGANPGGNLVLSSNSLYGTASGGGNFGKGTVFAVNTDGTGFRTFYNFGGGNDGANPGGSLILWSNILYGITSLGGDFGQGGVFAINTDGTGFTNLHSFVALSDGTSPRSLTLSRSTLYGTTSLGGSSGNGTVFSLRTDGTGFKVLHRFTAFTNGLNNDGANPLGGLTLSGNTLYGTAHFGGSSDQGTVFKLITDGTGFATLYSFSGTPGSPPYINTDGAGPWAGVILSGNTLYGATRSGGSSGLGTIFSITLPGTPPLLTINPSGDNVVLIWPTNAAGFQLESSIDLSANTVWQTVTNPIITVGDQNTVTTEISSKAKFFRLTKQ
jgi:uncharacterized repeat protein (TIGR03803 family)